MSEAFEEWSVELRYRFAAFFIAPQALHNSTLNSSLSQTERAARRIAEEAKAREVGTLVLGLPKNMDGTEGPRAEKSRTFRELLIRESGLPVILWDERRSSIEAHAILHSAGKKEKQHRKTVDAVAASLILEGYLGSGR